MPCEVPMNRPYLLFDVDGVLNPHFSNGSFRKRQKQGWYAKRIFVRGELYRVFFNPAYGPQLLQLAGETGAELAWATTWREDANEHIGPRIGLPELPFAPAYNETKDRDVTKWADGRPFVWLDNEYYVATSPLIKPPDHVVWVDEKVGLTDRDLEHARTWLLRQQEGKEGKEEKEGEG